MHNLALRTCTILIAFTASVALAQMPSNFTQEEIESRRERYTCGARTAYTLLRIFGIHTNYTHLRNHFSLTARGTSLSEIAETLDAQGLPCSVLHLEPSELQAIPAPFIVHVAKFREGNPDNGHYLVVTQVDDDGVRTLDPQYDIDRHYSWRVFSDRWYGYALVPERRRGSLWSAVLITAFLNIAVLLTLIYTCAKELLPRIHGTSLARSARPLQAIACVAVAATPSLSQASATTRSASGGARNAAMLLASMNEQDVDGGILRDASKDESLHDIAVNLESAGLSVEIKRLSCDQLLEINRPCIVPMIGSYDTADDNSVSFCVFLESHETDVYVVLGGPLLIQRVRVDEFRRCWNGMALYSYRHNRWPTAVLLGCVLLACYLFYFLYKTPIGRKNPSYV